QQSQLFYAFFKLVCESVTFLFLLVFANSHSRHMQRNFNDTFMKGFRAPRRLEIHREGTKYAPVFIQDGRRPARAQSKTSSQFSIVLPRRFVLNAGRNKARAQVGSGTARPSTGSDLGPIDERAVFGGQPGRGAVPKTCTP